jgi:hydroxymethylglutaryl-CoA reductase (NADPH)
VAQVPIGLAGPLRVDGEHAKGDFYVPLATTEGTLVASYSRGMRLTRECGGIKATVVDQRMQRAPVFLFADARLARQFGEWVKENFTLIKQVAETTTMSGKLIDIAQYAVGPNMYLRFNYTTADAAGQNMCGKATYAACEWIVQNYKPPQMSSNHEEGQNINRQRYMLSGSIDTDKKHSQMNMINTRGRRVVAETVLTKDVLMKIGGVTPEQLFEYRQIGNAGAQLAGSVYNGAHAANGLAGLFIATGVCFFGECCVHI